MNKLIETLISHGAGILTAMAGVLIAVAQVVKACRNPPSTKPSKNKPVATRESAPSLAPATIQPISFLKVVRVQMLTIVLSGACLAGMALMYSEVTLPRVIAVGYFMGQVFFNLWWATSERDRYLEGLADFRRRPGGR